MILLLALAGGLAGSTIRVLRRTLCGLSPSLPTHLLSTTEKTPLPYLSVRRWRNGQGAPLKKSFPSSTQLFFLFQGTGWLCECGVNFPPLVGRRYEDFRENGLTEEVNGVGSGLCTTQVQKFNSGIFFGQILGPLSPRWSIKLLRKAGTPTPETCTICCGQARLTSKSKPVPKVTQQIQVHNFLINWTALLDAALTGLAMPRGVQGQVGFSSEEPFPVKSVSAHGGGWNEMILRVPFIPNHSMILWLTCQHADYKNTRCCIYIFTCLMNANNIWQYLSPLSEYTKNMRVWNITIVAAEKIIKI